ncbi:MAG: hypothetical protein H8E59_09785 [Actinobacteria bacterium]|nr:hypothetical protein [Actinomycetota bacterium]
MTSAEALFMNGAGILAVGSVGLRRIRFGPLSGERRASIRHDTETFLRSMELDPDSVLGPATATDNIDA